MNDSAINWFEIYVADLNRAKTFYGKILNKPFQSAEMGTCQMSIFPYDPAHGVGGALTLMEGCKPGPGGTVVYLNVEGDLDGVLERILTAGGKIVRPRMDIAPHGFIGIFEDSEGNIVGLHSMV